MIDLFSGCGGMSCGFARRDPFRLVTAVDAEHAKPCEGSGKLDCNRTYAANIGIEPLGRNIAELDPEAFADEVRLRLSSEIGPSGVVALLCCPPCTDFSRAKPSNHLTDSPKNSLVVKCASFVQALRPEFVLMENARELISGNNRHHFADFRGRLEQLGYGVRADVYTLTRFGLPQIRERALVIASRVGSVLTLEDLWDGWEVTPSAGTVRHAIGHLNDRPVIAGEVDPRDPMHRAPGFARAVVQRRIAATPRDGGSWFDLRNHPDADELLIDSMRERLARNDLGSHPDVYGRMAWDRPAPTIKRECAHVGNGRYAHPEQDRLLTVREMSLLQGFPANYIFASESLANCYRHIGDAVPPLISYQLSALVAWMKTGLRPGLSDWLLPGASLTTADVTPQRSLFANAPVLTRSTTA